MNDLELHSLILNLELELESSKAHNSRLERKILDKDQQIGKLNSERIKVEALKKDIENKIRHFEENSLSKGLFTEEISELITYLNKQRKASQDEDSRKYFEKFAVLLKKAYDHY